MPLPLLQAQKGKAVGGLIPKVPFGAIDNPPLMGEVRLWTTAMVNQNSFLAGANHQQYKPYPPGDSRNPPAGWRDCDGTIYDGGTEDAFYKFMKGWLSIGPIPGQLYLPDMRARVPVGAYPYGGVSFPYWAKKIDPSIVTPNNPAGTARTFLDKGGEESHLVTTGEMAQHTHTLTDAGHTHTLDDPTHTHDMAFIRNNSGSEYLTTAANKGNPGSDTVIANTGLVATAAAQTLLGIGGAGGVASHNNMQPFLFLSYIIRVSL